MGGLYVQPENSNFYKEKYFTYLLFFIILYIFYFYNITTLKKHIYNILINILIYLDLTFKVFSFSIYKFSSKFFSLENIFNGFFNKLFENFGKSKFSIKQIFIEKFHRKYK